MPFVLLFVLAQVEMPLTEMTAAESGPSRKPEEIETPLPAIFRTYP
jgi:hypothetical protein